ncbi:MAG: FGGY family carbohydrate kinase [Chloroflexota bacterium]
MTLLLGLDVGTTSVKAGLFEIDGRQVAAAGREYQLAHPAPDRAEIDPETWWAAAVEAVRAAVTTPGVDASRIAAIGISSQGETVAAVDADGRAIAPALVWLDNRATTEARELEARFGAALVYERTGVPDVNPTWTAAKLLWWRRHEPELFRDAARFVLAEDFILRRLTGRFVTDGGIQCTTMLFDIRDGGWWSPMLEAVGVGLERLPEIVAPGSIVGFLTTAAADALGLPTGLPVVACGMDQGAGAVGVGNIGGGMISESTGGALTIQAAVDRHGADPTGRTPVYLHSAPGTYLYCPVCPTGGMALTWFRDQFGSPETEAAAAQGRSAYDLLTELAVSVPAGSDGLTMLPHLAGAFSPEYAPAARGVFAGFTLAHGRGHFVRAILEGVAFMLRRNLELLAGAGAHAPEVRSHGGGARSALWNQIKADVCGLPIVTLEGEDAAVRGDAMLAGVAVGAFPDLAAAERALVTTGARFEPDPSTRPAYDDAYDRYIRLFEAMRPEFERAGAAG